MSNLSPAIDPALLDRLARWSRHPWPFLCEAVFTQDEVDLKNPVKPAPVDLPYVRLVVEAWHQEPFLLIEKSRRMWMSWLMIALYLWDTLFNGYRHNFFQSDKESKSNDLVGRAEFIFDNIPEKLWPLELRPKKRRVENLLEFPETKSKIQAIAMGADQLRQYTASGILMDEFGFWPLARESYTTTRPTAEGGGRITIVSTNPPIAGAKTPFFYRLVDDELDKKDEFDE